MLPIFGSGPEHYFDNKVLTSRKQRFINHRIINIITMNSLTLLLEQNKGYISEEKTKERLERAAELYNHGLVEKVNDHLFIVKGQYTVEDFGDIEPIWKCTCADSMYRGVVCKHIMAVELYLIEGLNQ